MTSPDPHESPPTSTPKAAPPLRSRLLAGLLIGFALTPLIAAGIAYGIYAAGEHVSTVHNAKTIDPNEAASRAATDQALNQTGQLMGQALAQGLQAMMKAQQAANNTAQTAGQIAENAADQAANTVATTVDNSTTTINEDGNDDTVVQSSQGSSNMNIVGRGQNVSIVNGVVTINGVVQNGSTSTQGKGPVIDSVRTLGAFHRLKSSLAATITVVRGASPSVTIKAQENLLQHIQTEVKGDTLSLKTTGSISSQHPIEILVTTAEPLTSASISGVGRVDLGELSGDVDLDVSGSAHVSGHGTLGQVNADLSGVGSIDLKGSADKVRLDLSGTGRASLGDLQARTVKLNVSGVGNATVAAHESVVGDLSGVGSVHVRGNPSRRDIDRSGLGRVTYDN